MIPSLITHSEQTMGMIKVIIKTLLKNKAHAYKEYPVVTEVNQENQRKCTILDKIHNLP